MESFENKQTALIQECYDHITKVVKDNHTGYTYYTPSGFYGEDRYKEYRLWFKHLSAFATKPIVLNDGTIVMEIIVREFVHSAQIVIHGEHDGWHIEELSDDDVITIADKLTEMFNL
ncbi:MAG TPA: hypothetical protein DEQ84_00415 [Prevotellaceae bacterium]|nr:hypothetical protein [Prevotellaceae bacterium]